MARLKVIIQNFLESSTMKNINKNINKIIPFFRSDSVEELYSKKAANTKSSAIREILKVVGKPGFISFAGGLPDDRLFPLRALKKASLRAMKEYKSSAFQYSLTEGEEQLRQFIVDNFYKNKNLSTDNIMITHGSQQGLDLISKIFIDPENRVALSEPSYLGALQVFKANLARINTINTLDLNTSEIEKMNRANSKFLYIIPDFDNPTGNRMSVQNRELLLKKCKCLIVEDTAYRLLSYDNNILPSLFDLNTDKVVIQFGSFSKIIAPGFRIGWICAPKEIISKLVAAKQYSDLHSNTIGQLIIYKYLTTENWQEHINTIKKHYKEKRDTMISAIDKYFPEGYSLIKPEGGMFLWLGYNEDKVDFYKVLEKSILKGVAVVPGGEFSVNHNLDNYVRLNFTHSTPEKIDEGIKILGQVLKEMMHPN